MSELVGTRLLIEPRPGYWFVKVVGARRIIACKSPARLSRYMRVHGMRVDMTAPTDYNRY
jgi:hypothetical protein